MAIVSRIRSSGRSNAMPCQPVTTWRALRPKAEDKTPTGDQVERGSRLRQEGRRPAELVDDAGAKLDAFSAGGEGAEDGDGIGAIRLGHPNRLEAECLSALSELNRLGKGEAALIGQVQPELHRGIVPRRAPTVRSQLITTRRPFHTGAGYSA